MPDFLQLNILLSKLLQLERNNIRKWKKKMTKKKIAKKKITKKKKYIELKSI
jgi:hypothetical protein